MGLLLGALLSRALSKGKEAAGQAELMPALMQRLLRFLCAAVARGELCQGPAFSFRHPSSFPKAEPKKHQELNRGV